MARTHLISVPADLVCFVLPVVVAVVLLPVTRSLGRLEVPLVWWLPLGVFLEVAHVYATLFRTVLDSQWSSRNWKLCATVGPSLFLIMVLVNTCVGTWLGWSLLTYVAMFHFARQPYWIICLYKARRGEKDIIGQHFDYWACLAGAVLPILLWHPGAFYDKGHRYLSWFGIEEEFLFRLPRWTTRPLWAAFCSVPLLWYWREAWLWRRGRSLNIGKLWIMFAQYFTWFMGVREKAAVTSLAFINLVHGVSSLALVRHVAQRRYRIWRRDFPDIPLTSVDKLCESIIASPWRYLGVCIAFAILEEVSWDVLILHEYCPKMILGFRLPRLQGVTKGIVTSVLMMPQLSHYVLDDFIWRMSTRNPGLKEAVLGAPNLGVEAKAC